MTNLSLANQQNQPTCRLCKRHPHAKHPQKLAAKCAGYSLIELLISVTVLVALSGMAIPSFAGMIARNKIITQTNELFGALYLARSHAVAKQKNVHVCPIKSDENTRCSENFDFNANWTNGWLVFADNNRNANLDENDEILRIIEMPGSMNIVFNQRGRLRFFPDGSARSAGFYICDKTQSNYKHIYLLHSGRARVNGNLSAKQKTRCDQASAT